MSNLPKSKVGTRTLTLGGETVEIRGLLRKEMAAAFAPLGNDPAGADDDARELSDVLVVAFGCQVTEAEAREWMETAPGGHVVSVIETVLELSGMGVEVGKD